MDYAATARAAKARLKEIEAERETLLQIIAATEPMTSAATVVRPPIPRATAPRVRSRAAPGAMEQTKNAVTEILREKRRAMQTRELLELVRSRGVEVGGNDPVATLSARLSNADEFELHKGFGWWFSGEHIPPVITSMRFEEAEETTVEDAPSASSESNDKGGEPDAALT